MCMWPVTLCSSEIWKMKKNGGKFTQALEMQCYGKMTLIIWIEILTHEQVLENITEHRSLFSSNNFGDRVAQRYSFQL